jgi:hypothetical protein
MQSAETRAIDFLTSVFGNNPKIYNSLVPRLTASFRIHAENQKALCMAQIQSVTDKTIIDVIAHTPAPGE